MAINKNFVIKNGVEVNTNLLVGDSTLNKVGIATTVPGYTLHVGVGGGARGGIGATDITVSGIATIGVANSTSAALSVTGISTFDGLIDANGGVSARTAAVQDLTAERVVLAGTGGELEDSANLTFDGSTLTVSGDLDPTNVSIASTLQVAGVATFLSGTLVSGISTFESDIKIGTGITLQPHGGASFAGIVTVGGDLNVTGDYSVDEISARNLSLTGIATIGTGVTLQPHGGGSFAGIVTTGGVIDANGGINAATAKIEDLTDNRVVIAGTGGELEDSGNVTFDGSTLAVTGDETVSGKITVGSGASIHSSTGNAAFAGIVTTGGALIVGAGATITGNILPASDAGSDLGASGLEFKDLFIDGTANVDTLQVDENATVTGNLTVNGNVDLGDATSDTITATGRFDSNLVPSGDTQDLGTSSQEWRDLFIDGTAHIDSLVADTVDINGGSIDNTAVGGSSASTGAFTRVDADNVRLDGNTITTTSGDLTIEAAGGDIIINDNVDLNGTLDLDGSFTADNVRINGNKIDTTSGKLELDANNNEVEINADIDHNGALNTSGNLVCGGSGSFTNDVTAFTSDIRLKTDIEPIQNALDKVQSLNGFTYKHNEIAGELGLNTETRYAGVSAQDLQEVLPEAVKNAPASDEYLTVQYEKVVPLLIEAIKELKTEIEELKK